MQLKLKVSAADIAKANALVVKLAAAQKELDEFNNKLDRSGYTRISINWMKPADPARPGNYAGSAAKFDYVVGAYVDLDERAYDVTELVHEIMVARVERIKDEIGALGIELE
jgi:hypothetical protein